MLLKDPHNRLRRQRCQRAVIGIFKELKETMLKELKYDKNVSSSKNIEIQRVRGERMVDEGKGDHIYDEGM